MSGGRSKSDSSQSTSTKVVTTTTTQMRDVGLTGAQAVDMAAVLESGSVQSEQIRADSLGHIVQATGNAWNQLMGGAGLLVEKSAEFAENTINVAPIVTQELMRPSAELAGEMLRAPVDLLRGPSPMETMMPYLILIIAGGSLIYLTR